MRCSLLALLIAGSASAFRPNAALQPSRRAARSHGPLRQLRMSDGAGDGGGPAVTVLGGSGFVGSRVVQILSEKGCAVTSVSKSGKAPAWAKGEAWAKGVEWTALDLAKADDAALDAALGSAAGSALVSCVGVVGTDAAVLRDGNGLANVRAFEAGKRVGIERAVFVGVASEVAECKDGLPAFFAGYFEGKEQAEAAAADAAAASCMVRPTFIYGGDSFGLTPPRVNADYGSGVEQLLSLPPVKIVADALPSGLIKAGPVEKLPVGLVKVALRPPVSVEAVAGACAAAAMGEASGVLDGTAAINKAAGAPPATGLQEAIVWSGEKLVAAGGAFVKWVQNPEKEVSVGGYDGSMLQDLKKESPVALAGFAAFGVVATGGLLVAGPGPAPKPKPAPIVKKAPTPAPKPSPAPASKPAAVSAPKPAPAPAAKPPPAPAAKNDDAKATAKAQADAAAAAEAKKAQAEAAAKARQAEVAAAAKAKQEAAAAKAEAQAKVVAEKVAEQQKTAAEKAEAAAERAAAAKAAREKAATEAAEKAEARKAALAEKAAEQKASLEKAKEAVKAPPKSDGSEELSPDIKKFLKPKA